MPLPLRIPMDASDFILIAVILGIRCWERGVSLRQGNSRSILQMPRSVYNLMDWDLVKLDGLFNCEIYVLGGLYLHWLLAE